MTDWSEFYAAYKAAKKALAGNNPCEYTDIAQQSIPRIPGVRRAGRKIADALVSWIHEESEFHQAQDEILSVIGSVDPLRSAGVLGKWLLSAGFFTATVALQRAYASRLWRSAVWLPATSYHQKLLIAAVYQSDATMLSRLSRERNRRSPTPGLSLADVARLATGRPVQAADAELSWVVSGRHVGVLGPALLGDSEEEQLKACDVVVAPVQSTKEQNVLSIPDFIDIAYTRPWSGLQRVDWKESGLLVVLGQLKDDSLKFDGRVRIASTVRATGLMGHPTKVSEIVVDLLAAGARRITVGGANFHISTGSMYRDDEVRYGVDGWGSIGTPLNATSLLASHPPIEDRNFVRTLALSGRVRFLGELESVMRMPDLDAAKILESTWSIPRR